MQKRICTIWKVICYIQVSFKAGLTLIYSLMVEGKIFSAEYASLLFPNSQNHPIHVQSNLLMWSSLLSSHLY